MHIPLTFAVLLPLQLQIPSHVEQLYEPFIINAKYPGLHTQPPKEGYHLNDKSMQSHPSLEAVPVVSFCLLQA